MEIITELRCVLSDDDQPLPKRLKIAQNALNSVELAGINKEELVLEWFSKIGGKSAPIEIWNGLKNCLKLQNLENFRQTEINQEIITKLIKIISKSLKECQNNDLKVAILDCAVIILKNSSFKQFFKHNSMIYTNFLAVILKNIDNKHEIITILSDRNIFDQKIFVKVECSKNFVTKILPILFNIVVKFEDDAIESNVVKLIQKVLLQNKNFDTYLDDIFDKKESSNEFCKFFFEELANFYTNLDPDKAKLGFKIITTSFFEMYNSKNLELYKIFITFSNILGVHNQFEKYKIKEISLDVDSIKSLSIFSEVYNIVAKSKIGNTEIKGVKFDDFVKSLVRNLLENYKIDASLIKILQKTISLNPAIVDNLINDIILKVILQKKPNEVLMFYENFLISIFEMYLKLHRVHKFTSEILRSFKTALGEDKPHLSKNVDEILPKNVLTFYENCITQQSGKQIVSLMRTFIVFLQEFVDSLQDYATNPKKKVYVEVLSKLFYNFLYVVRIAEYSTTQLTVTKFCKDLWDMKDILRKFGTTLLNMEHDQPLMNCFLTLSEAWGELIILLKFYSKNPNGQELKDTAPIENLGDFSQNNMTYIHNFLDSKQWSVITQRIKNFGQKGCQEILNKILFQKIRGFLILENFDNNEVDLKQILGDSLRALDDDCYTLLTSRDTSILGLLDPESEIFSKVADQILTEYLENQNMSILLSNKNLVSALLFSWFTKFSALFKPKRRVSEPLKRSLISKIHKCLEPNFSNFEGLSTHFEETLESDIESSAKVDQEKVKQLLDILKTLPVWALNENLQKMLFVFLLALRIDLHLEHEELTSTIENLLKGIVESPWAPNFLTILSPEILVQILVKKTKSYKNLLVLILNKGIKDPNTTVKILSKIDTFPKLTNDQNLEILTKILSSFQKINKSKLDEEDKAILKEYKSTICGNLVEKVCGVNKINQIHLDGFVLLLNYFLITPDTEKLPKLIGIHKKYVDFCLEDFENNSELALCLFEISLRNKSKFELETDFVLKVWTYCTKIKVFEKDIAGKQLNRTLSLVFELNSLEEFSKILDELLALTVGPLTEEINPLDSKNFEIVNNYMQLWHCLINSALSTQKQEIFFKILVKFFENVINFLVKNEKEDFDEIFVQLQLNTINNKQITPSGNMIDVYLETVSILLSRNYEFSKKYNLAYSILSSLIETRKYFIIDRLPSYMANVRLILNALCSQSNTEPNVNVKSTSENKEPIFDRKILDCAFQFEKMIRRICYLKKDMARIAPYLIGDILKNYEKTVFVHGVKNYLDNCIFLLLEICDQHAVSYLFRVLSPASTELFKNIYDNYHKYHKFAGRI